MDKQVQQEAADRFATIMVERGSIAWRVNELEKDRGNGRQRAGARLEAAQLAAELAALAELLDRPCYTPPIDKPTRAELIDAGQALADIVDGALEMHIYEPGEVPDDAPELEALEAWRQAIGPIEEPELTVAPQPVPIGPPAYEEEPEAERTGAYRVRFYRQTTTTDRHTIVVRASSGEAARDRVEAWGTGKIELTDAEELTEELEREEGIDASEFSQLEEEGDPYAVVELEAAELA